MTAPYWPDKKWATHDANGRALGYPGPDGKTLYREGYPADWFEVHEHRDLRGGGALTSEHSHPLPNAAHDGYGPATFTVSSRRWAKTTGLRGGGTKRFTAKPWGPQL